MPCIAKIPLVELSIMTDVTRILARIERGDQSAPEQLLPLVYDELRKLAAAKLTHEKPGQTLQATALVHEAYLRLVDVSQAQEWNSRGHFFGAAAEAMRRILVDNARRKGRLRHGGERHRVDLTEDVPLTECSADDLVALDEALTKFATIDPKKTELVKLRYFAGLTINETAEIAQVSRNTAMRHLAYARAWLAAEISDAGGN